MVTALLESLPNSVGDGLRTDSGGFKTRAWSETFWAINDAAPDGVDFEMTPIKSKITTQRHGPPGG
jgi:hypothetical protein